MTKTISNRNTGTNFFQDQLYQYFYGENQLFYTKSEKSVPIIKTVDKKLTDKTLKIIYNFILIGVDGDISQFEKKSIDELMLDYILRPIAYFANRSIENQFLRTETCKKIGIPSSLRSTPEEIRKGILLFMELYAYLYPDTYDDKNCSLENLKNFRRLRDFIIKQYNNNICTNEGFTFDNILSIIREKKLLDADQLMKSRATQIDILINKIKELKITEKQQNKWALLNKKIEINIYNLQNYNAIIEKNKVKRLTLDELLSNQEDKRYKPIKSNTTMIFKNIKSRLKKAASLPAKRDNIAECSRRNDPVLPDVIKSLNSTDSALLSKFSSKLIRNEDLQITQVPQSNISFENNHSKKSGIINTSSNQGMVDISSRDYSNRQRSIEKRTPSRFI